MEALALKGIVNVRKVLKGKIARLRAAHQSVKMEEPVWEDHALAKLISVVNIAKRSCHLAHVRMGMILMGNLMGMLNIKHFYFTQSPNLKS